MLHNHFEKAPINMNTQIEKSPQQVVVDLQFAKLMQGETHHPSPSASRVFTAKWPFQNDRRFCLFVAFWLGGWRDWLPVFDRQDHHPLTEVGFLYMHSATSREKCRCPRPSTFGGFPKDIHPWCASVPEAVDFIVWPVTPCTGPTADV